MIWISYKGSKVTNKITLRNFCHSFAEFHWVGFNCKGVRSWSAAVNMSICSLTSRQEAKRRKVELHRVLTSQGGILGRSGGTKSLWNFSCFWVLLASLNANAQSCETQCTSQNNLTTALKTRYGVMQSLTLMIGFVEEEARSIRASSSSSSIPASGPVALNPSLRIDWITVLTKCAPQMTWDLGASQVTFSAEERSFSFSDMVLLLEPSSVVMPSDWDGTVVSWFIIVPQNKDTDLVQCACSLDACKEELPKVVTSMASSNGNEIKGCTVQVEFTVHPVSCDTKKSKPVGSCPNINRVGNLGVNGLEKWSFT